MARCKPYPPSPASSALTALLTLRYLICQQNPQLLGSRYKTKCSRQGFHHIWCLPPQQPLSLGSVSAWGKRLSMETSYHTTKRGKQAIRVQAPDATSHWGVLLPKPLHSSVVNRYLNPNASSEQRRGSPGFGWKLMLMCNASQRCVLQPSGAGGTTGDTLRMSYPAPLVLLHPSAQRQKY